MTTKNLIEKYVKNNTVMQLATVSNGLPQLCTVHYAVDEDLNFYWFSARSSHHSQAIQASKNVAIGVLHSIELRQCVHSQGQAHIATDDEVMKAHDCYTKRFGENPENLKQAVSSDPESRAYYVYTPGEMVLFDLTNFPENPRQELIVSS